jgi:hypothetical protein
VCFDGQIARVCLVVGLPPTVKTRLEREFRGQIDIHSILIERDGGFSLELIPPVAAQFVEHVFFNTQDGLLVVMLPYAEIHAAVGEAIDTIEALGTRIIRPQSNADGWPARSPTHDNVFQADVLRQLVALLRQMFDLPAVVAAIDPEDEIMCELLRGLATHHKMGRNNHSHEDDFWKDRGKGLQPKDKHKIAMRMIAAGLIDRKKNDSMGGKGWVYWIADVQAVRIRFPVLSPYLE